MQNNKVYSKNDNFSIECLNDEKIFINYETGRWIKINDTANLIVEKVDGEKTIEKIYCEISDDLSLPIDMIESMYKETIQSLISVGLISSEENEEDEVDETEIPKNYFRTIWIHVTDKCNLMCQYCYFKETNIIKDDLDIEKTISFLCRIPEDERDTIIISGGEPYLYDGLYELLKRLKDELGFKHITVITNGTVNHDRYKDILPLIDIQQFSIDGIKAQTNDITRGEGSFEKIIEGINICKKINIDKVSISTTITTYNIDEVKQLPEFAYTHGISRINLNKLYRVGRGKDFPEVAAKEELDKQIELFGQQLNVANSKIHYQRETMEIGKGTRRRFITYTSGFDLRIKANIGGKLISCGMAVNIMSITPDGKIYPCPSLHKDDYSVGDLNSRVEDIKEKGRAMNDEYNVMNEKTICFNCRYKFFCGGGCRAEALEMGDVYGEDSECLTFYDELLSAIGKI